MTSLRPEEPGEKARPLRLDARAAQIAADSFIASAHERLRLGAFWIEEDEAGPASDALRAARALLREVGKLLEMAARLGCTAADLNEEHRRLERRSARVQP